MEEWIINTSNVLLPPEVVDIVSLGLKFNVKSNFRKKSDIVDTMKNLQSQWIIAVIDNNVNNTIRTVITTNISQNFKNKVPLTYTDNIFNYNLKTTKLFIKNG